MNLILWRHADAEDGIPDTERKLTAKGIKQAKRMAKWLASHIPEDTVIVVSPAKRALQTARALSTDIRILDGVGTSATAESLLAAVDWPNSNENVLVVGHQPTLGEIAAFLLTGRKRPCDLRKGALIWVACREYEGARHIHLRAAISPDLL